MEEYVRRTIEELVTQREVAPSFGGNDTGANPFESQQKQSSITQTASFVAPDNRHELLMQEQQEMMGRFRDRLDRLEQDVTMMRSKLESRVDLMQETLNKKPNYYDIEKLRDAVAKTSELFGVLRTDLQRSMTS